MSISAVVHTRDSERRLEEALSSIAWADEVLVADMASRDGTLEIARRFAHRVVTVAPVDRVDGTRNAVVDEARGEWILVLDSDERLAEDAGENLRRLVSDLGDRYDAFALPRFNTICGQVLRGGLWYPDHQIRLFRKGTVTWDDSHHRQPLVLTGRGRLLELVPPDCPHIHHANYENLHDFIRRQVHYALTDRYDPDPGSFDISATLERAHEIFALRHDDQADGDLSHALALLMAWDALVRGLLHWDTFDPRPPLEPLVVLPPRPLRRLPRLEVAGRRWLGRRHSLRFLLHRGRDRALDLLARCGLRRRR